MIYFTRFLLLLLAFTFTTAGLMGWQTLHFSFAAVWPMDGPLALHPLHLLVLGLAMIPPAIWEIFVLERLAHDRSASAAEPKLSPTAPPTAPATAPREASPARADSADVRPHAR
jgi:hypothetical protein